MRKLGISIVFVQEIYCFKAKSKQVVYSGCSQSIQDVKIGTEQFQTMQNNIPNGQPKRISFFLNSFSRHDSNTWKSDRSDFQVWYLVTLKKMEYVLAALLEYCSTWSETTLCQFLHPESIANIQNKQLVYFGLKTINQTTYVRNRFRM